MKIEIVKGLFVEKTADGRIRIWLEGPVGVDATLSQDEFTQAIQNLMVAPS